MSIYVIGDQDTILGFRLLGAQGRVVESVEEARQELEKTLQNEEIKLLFITRDWADGMREHMDRLKMTSLRPVVMEIPGREAEAPEESLGELVRRAIGISL